MPKSSNQKLKLLLLRDMLLKRTDEEHGVTMSDILSMLEENGIEAERKSIYDDIRALSEYGMDIAVEKGKYSKYKLLSSEFEEAELKYLVDAVQSSKFLTLKKSRELISKLEGLTSEYQAKKLQGQVVVANRIKSMNETIYYSIDIIHNAIADGNKIRFKYYTWSLDFSKMNKVCKDYKHKGEEYTVSPYRLIWDNENYYLSAYDDGEDMIKTFRVDKMDAVHQISEKRNGEEKFKDFDVSKYTKSVFSMFAGSQQKVTIRFENTLANVVIDRFGKDLVFIPDDDSHFKITVPVEVSPQFYAWVFGLGKGAEIVSPQGVVDEMKKTLNEISKIYGG